MVAFAILLPATAEAQKLADLRGGSEIRFRPTPTSEWHRGRLEKATEDSLGVRLCVACKSETYAFADIDLIQSKLKVGGTHTRQGAALGALSGVVIPLILDAQCYRKSRGNELAGLCGLGVLYIPPFALVGGVIGGVLGHQIPNRDWVTVYRRTGT